MESIDEFYAAINYKDGINRDEAKLIAKKYLTESKYSGQFQVWGPIITGAENYWIVSFLYKSLETYEQILDVYVDTLTGQVKDTKVRHKDTPVTASDFGSRF